MAMLELTFYPLYGLVLGVDYIDDHIEGNHGLYEGTSHEISIYLFLIGISLRWYTNKENGN